MRKIIVILFILLSSFDVFGQKQDDLLGEWLLVSLSSDNFNLNKKTNTLNLTKNFKENYSDSTDLNNAVKKIEELTADNKLIFEKDGKIKFKILADKIKNGKYSLDTSSKIITINFRTNDGNPTFLEFHFSIKDGLLRLKNEGELILTIILEKKR